MTWNDDTSIGWTDVTWNTYHGCAKTSEGCLNCYAANLSLNMGWTDEEWTVINLDDNFMLYPHAFAEPDDKDGRWVWGASMSDPWVPALSPVVLAMQVGKMWANPQHQFLLLTKWGPDRARSEKLVDPVVPPLPENVALGVTVETRRREYRLDWLREQDATWKFVSFEPLLEPVVTYDEYTRTHAPDMSGIDMAIIGGESGDNRREWDAEWASDLIVECSRQEVAPFFKQHGHRFPEPAAEKRPHERTEIRMGDWKGEIRAFPETPNNVPDAPQEYL